MNVRAGTAGLLHEHRLVLFAALTTALIAAVYWQSFSRIIEMWSHASYQHGWLVYPVAFYILWRKRHTLSSIRLQGSWPGVTLTAFVVLTWIVARSIGVQTVEFLAATMLIFAAFWAIAGRRAAEKAAFPLLLLLAAVPIGDALIDPLMDVTATIAGGLLNAVGVPAYRDGRFFTLPGGTFEVARVCSGLRYLLAGAMASLAYAYVSYASFSKRAVFVGIAAIVLVIANGVRAFIIMLVASTTDMRVFAGEDHVIFGMILFTLVLMALIFFGERHADAGDQLGGPRDIARSVGKGGFPVVTAAVVFLLVLSGPALQFVKAQGPEPAAVNMQLPDLPGCNGPAEWDRDWSPEFRGADRLHRGSYACSGFQGSVYVASYASQEQGKELINTTNRVWPRDWRRYVEETSVSFASEQGEAEVRQALVRAPERVMLIWYWYQAGDSVTASPLKVKLGAALHALAFRPREASVAAVAMTADRDADPLALREEMESLAGAIMSWNRATGE